MAVNFLNWGIPALLTVVVGTAAAMATSGAALSRDLQARSAVVLSDPHDAWASVRFEMRDAFVSGTAPNDAAVEAVLQQVAEVHGVRSVTTDAVVADAVSPYPFEATIADGVITLTGAVPDAEARTAIEEIAGARTVDNLQVTGGVPDRATWLAAVTYAVRQLQQMDEGTVSLSNLELTVTGRAKDAAAYDTLNGGASPPASMTVASRQVEPAIASPYVWQADFDGHAVTLTGDAPDEAFADALSALAPAGVTVSGNLTVASGAPAGFADDAKLLMQNLLKLEQGSAKISDSTLAISGLPPDTETARTITAALAATGAELTLGAPRVAVYRLAAERRDGKTILSGYVPDDSARTRLGQFLGVDASALELGRGAPENFQAASDLLLQALDHMTEGTGSLDGTAISLSGRAESTADYAALETLVGLGAPEGLTFATTEIRPPLASPYTWTAAKADGDVTFTGDVPSRAAQQALISGVSGKVDASKLVLADGAPADFQVSALKGLALLDKLSSGSVAFDGKAWSVTGSVDSAEAGDAAKSAFSAAGLARAGWKYDVTSPPPPPAIVDVSPYRFEATKGDGGTLAFKGYLPSDDVRKELATRADGEVEDESTLGNGAPSGFATSADAGLDALMSLDKGTLSLNGDSWSLDGTVGTTKQRLEIQAALGSATDASAWHVAIQAADAAPVVSPFRWAAAKGEDGRYSFSGYVPTTQLKTFLAVRADKVAEDASLVGSGEPAGFTQSALAGLDALSHLASGKVAFDGKRWSLTGQPASEPDVKAVSAALSSAADGGAGWATSLSEPPAAPEVAAAPDQPVPAATAEAPAATSTTDAAEALPQEAAAASAPDVGQPDQPASAAGAPVAETDTATASEAEAPAAGSEQTATAATPEATAEAPTAPTETAPVQPASPAPADTAAQPAAPSATVAEAEPVAPPAAEPLGPDVKFEASKLLGGAVSFTGMVPADPVRTALAQIAGTKPTDQLTVNAAIPESFTANAEAGAKALVALADGEVGLDSGTWVLKGRAVNDAQRQAALSTLDGASGPWRTDVSLVPPMDYCQAELTAFGKRNAILFKSGSATITTGSTAALDELAGDLAQCPAAQVDVEGHTDADGDADANLALSVDRATAVVNALIARGIGEERLYAVGYGESLPVASNDTAAGKQANRRIAFSIHQGD